MRIPHKIKAREALIAIARSRHSASAGVTGLSKADMVNLARVACKTEGIAWEGSFAEAKAGLEKAE